MRKEKRHQVMGAKMAVQVDNRLQQLLPGIVTAMQASVSSGQPINTSIHRGFQCDGCKNKPIVGVRHNCKECNFDLCAACVTKVSHPHPLTQVDTAIKRNRPMGPGMRPGRPAQQRPEGEKTARPNSLKKEGSTERDVKKVVKIQEPTKPVEDCPEWLKSKRDQLVSMFDANPAKAAKYLLANKFAPFEEIVEKLLSNPAELAKLQ
jgi:hypothetical protein